jgi:hypothetical protein
MLAKICRFIMLMLMVTTLGCTTKVTITPDSYKPHVSLNQQKRFANKKIYMGSFTNSAQNTSMWNYYSPDQKIRYETNQSLQSYFWYCYRYAFEEIGVTVAPYEYGMIEFQYEMVSLTDELFRFNVNLTRNRTTIFQKMYSVSMTPPNDRSVPALQTRAYKLVDKSFETIMNDPLFLASFGD